MSRIGTFIITFLLSLSNPAHSQNCELSGAPAWSPQLRYIIGGCNNRFASPNGKYILQIDFDGKIQVVDRLSKSVLSVHSKIVEPPAMVSWAATSNAFFINDGEGSGMSSVFRLFIIKNGQVTEESTIQKKSIALFRNIWRCSSTTADPNVWGIAWSRAQTEIHLLIQSTTNNPCGVPGAFLVITARLADGAILEQYKEEEAKSRFRGLLPEEVYSK